QAEPAMSDRDIIKIAVTPQAKAAIEAAGLRYGMSQIELASRMYAWFAEQDEVVQAAILDLLPRELAPDVARLALRRLASHEHTAAAQAPIPGYPQKTSSPRAAGTTPAPAPASSGPQRKAAKPAPKPVHVTPKPTDSGAPKAAAP